MMQMEMFHAVNRHFGPIQIVHDFQFVALNLKADLYEFGPDMDENARRAHIKARLDRLKERGYAGIVISVDNRNYLQDEAALERMAWTVDYAWDLGMRIWLYDEQYYPTGAAGGLVLKGHPELEAMALCCVEKEVDSPESAVRVMSPMGHSSLKYAYARSESGKLEDISHWHDPAGNLCWDCSGGKWHVYCFFLRPMYDGSNYMRALRARRRYPCVCDKRVIERFLQVTYEPYARVLGNRLAEKIEAVFTDEPSNSMYGEWPKDSDPDKDNERSRFPSVSIYDRPEIQIPGYPFLPWPDGIEETFQERNGYALAPILPDLFGREPAMKQRRDFFETMGAMFDAAYNDQFVDALSRYDMLYSGHWLAEESFTKHPYLYGDVLYNMGRMDIPGCDMLFSAPEKLRHALACKVVSSAAHQYGRAHSMIEASNMCDADQTFSVERIQLAMAMIFAMGVDTITSYYGEELFDEAGYRRFTAYTSRLGALLDGGTHESQALVYYPYEQFAALSVVAKADPFPEAVAMQRALEEISETLLSEQVDYDFINKEILCRCSFENGRVITPCGERPGMLIFPDVPFVDAEMGDWIARAVEAGVRVIFVGKQREIPGLAEDCGVEFAEEALRLQSMDFRIADAPKLVCMHKRFEGRQVYLLVNTGETEINREASVPGTGGELLCLDFDTGEIRKLPFRDANGRRNFALRLPAMTAMALAVEEA